MNCARIKQHKILWDPVFNAICFKVNADTIMFIDGRIYNITIQNAFTVITDSHYKDLYELLII